MRRSGTGADLALRGAAADQQGRERGALCPRRPLGGPGAAGARSGTAGPQGRPGGHLPDPGEPGRRPRPRGSRAGADPGARGGGRRRGRPGTGRRNGDRAAGGAARTGVRTAPRRRRRGPPGPPGGGHDLGRDERGHGGGHRGRRDTRAGRYGVARRPARLRQVVSVARARDWDHGGTMAGAMHKMAVYLGLVEDDRQYDDGYDSYEEEYPGYEEHEEAKPGAAAGPANLLAGDSGAGAARVA